MAKVLKFLKKFDIIILSLLIVLLSIFLRDVIPIGYKVKAFTVSHILKTILMFLIPFLLFSFMDMKHKGTYLIVLILVFVSNFFLFVFLMDWEPKLSLS